MSIFYSDDAVTIHHADALALPVEDSSVDLVVTSPPYFSLRSYQDGGEHYAGQIGSEATPAEFVDALAAATREMVRVLKPSGSIWVNLGDKYAGSPSGPRRLDEDGWQRDRSYTQDRRPPVAAAVPQKSLIGIPWRYALRCIDDLGLILRAEVIWSKPNGLPESVTDRVRRSHEQWFHFTKAPRYFSAVDEVREAYDAPDATRTLGKSMRAGVRTTTPADQRKDARDVMNPLGKLPGSVWEIPTQPLRVPEHLGVDHFAAFPMEFPRRIIRGWSPSGICVECGEGRRPVTTAARIGVTRRSEATTQIRGGGSGGGYALPGADTWKRTDVTITGEACACPEPTAPTRPAVVLDPFGGTGTTALVARALGRRAIHVDLSADYCRLARWRVTDPGELARAMQVDKPDPVAEDQSSLLDLLEGAS